MTRTADGVERSMLIIVCSNLFRGVVWSISFSWLCRYRSVVNDPGRRSGRMRPAVAAGVDRTPDTATRDNRPGRDENGNRRRDERCLSLFACGRTSERLSYRPTRLAGWDGSYKIEQPASLTRRSLEDEHELPERLEQRLTVIFWRVGLERDGGDEEDSRWRQLGTVVSRFRRNLSLCLSELSEGEIEKPRRYGVNYLSGDQANDARSSATLLF